MEPSNSFPRKIVLDTSMLLAIEQHKIDVFNELKQHMPNAEFYITEEVMKELEKLASGSQGKRKQRHAKIAVELIKKNRVKMIKTGKKHADVGLIELAKQGYAVASTDGELRKKIKKFAGRIIYLRKSKFLFFE
jgi:rRNA-processing protein FCF1